MNDQIGESGGSPSAKKVVRIWISQLRHPHDLPLGGITLEQVHDAFSKCGSIEKIICDASSGDAGGLVQFILQFIQVMVQYSLSSMAIAAVETLDGLSLTGDAFNKMRVHASPYDILAFGTFSGRPGPGESRSWMTYVPMEDIQKPYLSSNVRTVHSSSTGRKVIAIHITNLEAPTQPPIAGFHIHFIHDLCAEFGVVEKVVCIYNQYLRHTSSKIVALVEFSKPENAVRALCRLHGCSLTKNQYHQMHVQMSRRAQLHVNSKNCFAWDYTLEPRLSGAQAPAPSEAMRCRQRQQEEPGQISDRAPARQEPAQAGRVLLVHITDLEHPSQKPLGGLKPGDLILGLRAAGPLEKLIVLNRHGDDAFFVLAQFSSPDAAKTAEERLTGSSLTGNGNFNMSVQVSVKDELTMKPHSRLSWDFTGEERRRKQTGSVTPPDGCMKLIITNLRRPQKVSMPGGVHVFQVRTACQAFGEVRQVLCSAYLEQSAIGLPRSLRFVEAVVEFKDAESVKAAQGLNGKSLTQDKHNFVEVREADVGINKLKANTTWCWSSELPPRPLFAAEFCYSGLPVAEHDNFSLTQTGASACPAVFFAGALREARSAWPEPLPLRERGFGADDEELALEPLVAEALFTGSKADDIDDLPSTHLYYSASSGNRGAWMSRTSRAPRCRNKLLERLHPGADLRELQCPM